MAGQLKLDVLQRQDVFSSDTVWRSADIQGQPDSLRILVEVLNDAGWSQLNDRNWEGGFIYPRRSFQKDSEIIRAGITKLDKLAEKYGMEVVVVDAWPKEPREGVRPFRIRYPAE